MKNRKHLIFLLFGIVVFAQVIAQERPNGERAKAYIHTIASDEMEGRDTGSKGYDKATAYIIQHYKNWGLEPAGDNGTYIQSFPFRFYKSEFKKPIFMIEDRTFYSDDWEFYVMRYSGGGSVTGEVVFAGYGISDPEGGLDEYADVDVKDKIVMVMHGCPGGDVERWKSVYTDSAKASVAQARGAKGLLICSKLTDEYRNPGWRWRLRSGNYRKDFIVYALGERAANYLLQKENEDNRSRNRRFGRIQRQLDTQLKSISYATGKIAKMSVKVQYIPEHIGKNVLAKISGSDPNVGDEVIVLGAHLDHEGIRYGEVYNGADDNASGSAVVMELARVMKVNGIQPKRTILFALWGGEERGLLGSEFYVENPPIPVEKTVLNFNMDMVGLGKTCGISGKYYSSHIWEIIKESNPDSVLEFIDESRGGPGGSDHTPFLINGIPAYFLIGSPWSAHPYYHQPQDDAEAIDVDLLEKTAQFVYENSILFADYEGNLILENRLENYIYKSAVIVNIGSIPYRSGQAVLDSLEKKHIDIQFFHITLDQAAFPTDNVAQSLDNFYQDASMGSHGDVSVRQLFDMDREETDPIIGIRGAESIRNSLQNLRIAAKMGAKYFTFVGADNIWISPDSGLTVQGREAIQLLNKQKMLTIFENVTEKNMFSILENSKLPVIFVMESTVREDSLLEAVQQSRSILALKYCPKSGVESVIEKILQLKDKIKLKQVLLVPETELTDKMRCMDKLLDVVIALKEAEIENDDIRGLLGENLEDVFKAVFDQK